MHMYVRNGSLIDLKIFCFCVGAPECIFLIVQTGMGSTIEYYRFGRLLSVLLRFTDSDYSFSIFKLFL
jgi:hypothetical protein